MTREDNTATRNALPALKWAVSRRVLDVGCWATEDDAQPVGNTVASANEVHLFDRDLLAIVGVSYLHHRRSLCHLLGCRPQGVG